MNTKLKLDLKIEMMIISVVAFLTAIIGVSFAWLRSNLSSSSSNLFVGSAGLTLSYHGTSSITNLDMAPGEKFEKTFEVENSGDSPATYNLLWKDVTNTLTDKNYFMYTIENVDTGEQLFLPKYLPTNSTHIIYNVPIAASETHSYKLTIYYVNDPKYNQLQNSNLEFKGDIRIDVTEGERDNSEVLSIFVNGTHSDYLPTLSSYTIDTSRTFCTDGSSISIVNNDIQIDNQKDTTTCDLYLVSSSASAITHDPYNLLVIDLDGATLNSATKTGYRYSGDIIDLGIPEKSGYAFLGWEISGSGSSIVENTKVKMGDTYTYVKANWTKGHWNKVVQTCSSGAPTSYTKKYQTCEQSINDYTKVEKTCGVSSWNKTTSVCGITAITKKTYVCGNNSNKYSYPSSPTTTSSVSPSNCTVSNPPCNSATDYNNGNTKVTCTDPKTYNWTSPTTSTSETCTVSGSCSSSTFGNSYVTACAVAAYNFGDATTSTVNSCTPNNIACSSSTNSQINRTCAPNYSYSLSSETTVTADACYPSEFTCSENTVGDEYVTECTSSGSGYGFVASTVETGYCLVDESHDACSSSTTGQTYVSACELIEIPIPQYIDGASNPREVRIGSEEFYVLNDILNYSSLISTNGNIYNYAADKSILLAKYNLYVGRIYNSGYTEISASSSGYGLQSVDAKGFVDNSTPRVAVVPFSGSSNSYGYWYDSANSTIYSKYGTGTSYNASNIYDTDYITAPNYSVAFLNNAGNANYSIAYYVEEYVDRLGIEGTGRLLTYTEANAMTQAQRTNGASYWLGSAGAGSSDGVWSVDSGGGLSVSSFSFVNYGGVRPVIVVNTSDIGA